MCEGSCPLESFKYALDAFLQIESTKMYALYGALEYEFPNHFYCKRNAVVLDKLIIVLSGT